MPEAVVSFVTHRDFTEVREIQRRLLLAYEQDFSKHASHETVHRIRMLWSSIPAQLAKENRKFIYGLVRHGARAREYELALQWLLDCGLIYYREGRVSKPAMPLAAYHDSNAFKLFVVDVGLLATQSGLDVKSLLDGNRVFEEFNGSLTEQYVLQQLVAHKHTTPYYWTAEKSDGVIDFVFQRGSDIVPLEVKAAENLQSKSLKSYCQRYRPEVAIRTSMSDYRKEEWLTNIPLYAINAVMDIV